MTCISAEKSSKSSRQVSIGGARCVALELPPVQRLTLARIRLDLSDESQVFPPEVEADWETEICRRMAEVKASHARSCGFDEMVARLDQHFHPGQLN